MAKNEAEAKDPRTASTTEQLKQQTGAVRDDLGQLGRLAKQAAKEKLDDAREAASGYYGHGRKKADELETQVADYVRTKPLKSILIAAGVGALFGILISRR
jgi:ElaB/YqjD/DUF883 family membrane-anchored ribosome-binding protein